MDYSHILGRAYERSLAKTERRKADGVYYTPRYIVDRIVEETVGRAVQGKPLEEIASLRIVDPACGSGAFLLGAFDRLCDHYRLWTPLDSGLKRQIARRHIFGIDIDPQAVELTRLSLSLETAGGETLPDLSRNIQCGNALAGSDAADPSLRPFDWEPAFPEAFAGGGFDVVIGNPPYRYSAGRRHKEYFERAFTVGEYQTDYYVYFVEQAIRKLKPNGRLGMIVSNSWMKGKRFSKLRDLLLNRTRLSQITVFEYPPFDGAAIESSIIVLEKRAPAETVAVYVYRTPECVQLLNQLSVAECAANGRVDARFNAAAAEVIAAIERNSIPLDGLCLIHRGVHAYRTDGYGKSKFAAGRQTKRDKAERSYHARQKLDETYWPEVKGKHLLRYGYRWDGGYVSYGDWLAEPRRPELFMSPKLAVRKILGPRLVCTYIEEPLVLDQSVYVAIARPHAAADLLFALGTLASAVGGWYLRTKHAVYDRLYPWFTKEQLAHFPLPGAGDAQARRRIAELAGQMLRAKVDEREKLDAQIDQAVFDLYGLSAEQQRVITDGSSEARAWPGIADETPRPRRTPPPARSQ